MTPLQIAMAAHTKRERASADAQLARTRICTRSHTEEREPGLGYCGIPGKDAGATHCAHKSKQGLISK